MISLHVLTTVNHEGGTLHTIESFDSETLLIEEIKKAISEEVLEQGDGCEYNVSQVNAIGCIAELVLIFNKLCGPDCYSNAIFSMIHSCIALNKQKAG